MLAAAATGLRFASTCVLLPLAVRHNSWLAGGLLQYGTTPGCLVVWHSLSLAAWLHSWLAHTCCCLLQCGTTPGWLEAFTKCAETLEAVQKGIEDYLETKRVAFPR
jgi:hypothetical protein